MFRKSLARSEKERRRCGCGGGTRPGSGLSYLPVYRNASAAKTRFKSILWICKRDINTYIITLLSQLEALRAYLADGGKH